VIVAVLMLLQTAPAPAAPRFELPAGPLANRVTALDPATAPSSLPAADLSADWSDPATFERWRSAMAEVAEHEANERVARARLSILALRQGRDEDAWRHLEAAAGDPALCAALLPRFLPGIDATTPAGAGGLPPALPDGVVLTPATPPRTRPTENGRVERRSMRVRGLRVGDAVIGLTVAVEPEGVQIDLEHISGGAARVAVRLPREAGFTFANEYVDWFQAEQRGAAHAVTLQPGDEPHTLYGRFEPMPDAQPVALPKSKPAVLELGGIEIRPEPGPEGRARAEALAKALSGAPFALKTAVRADGEPAGAWSTIQVDLRDPRNASARVAALCSAAERFRLR
jgi:hypothetical protein